MVIMFMVLMFVMKVHGYNVYGDEHKHLMVAQSHGIEIKSIVELGDNAPLELSVPGVQIVYTRCTWCRDSSNQVYLVEKYFLGGIFLDQVYMVR